MARRVHTTRWPATPQTSRRLTRVIRAAACVFMCAMVFALSSLSRPTRATHRHRHLKLHYATPSAPPKSVFATYFPQFHEFDENNRLWGQGFTDFTNVQRVMQNVHGQPVVRPASEAGFYDLTAFQSRRMQSDLASAYGVTGFVMYHYWFDGAPVMDKPLQLMLRDGAPNTTFCLSWANEPWTRRWDGADGTDVLIEQRYDEATWRAHVDWLVPFFKHGNYWRVDGKPVLFVYRADSVPDIGRMTAAWQRLAKSHGLPGIHFIQTLGKAWTDRAHTLQPGMAGTAEHYPNYIEASGWAMNEVLSTATASSHHIFGVGAAFDNTPRHASKPASATVVLSHPSTFYFWLRQNLARTQPGGAVLINAWNEWGEGAVLEPSDVWGVRWLEAVRDAVRDEARGHVAQLLDDGFVAAVPLGAAGVGEVPRHAISSSRICIIIRAHQRHQTGMFNLQQSLNSLLALHNPAWDAYIVNSYGALSLPAMIKPYTAASGGRIRMAAVKPMVDVTRGGDDAIVAVKDAVDKHCASYAWAVVAQAGDWYTPDAFDYLPADADVVWMRQRNYGKAGCRPLTGCSPAGSDHTQLGGRVFRTRSKHLTRAVLTASTTPDTLTSQSYTVAHHPTTACAFYRRNSRPACALVGGFWYDHAVTPGCYYLSTQPWNASRVDYGAFVASVDACVVERER